MTRQRLVEEPEILVTKAASPKPISLTRWQKLSSPVSSQIRALAPAGSWQTGMRFLREEKEGTVIET